MKVMFEKLKWTSKKKNIFFYSLWFQFGYINQMQNLSNQIFFESCVIYYKFIGEWEYSNFQNLD